METPALKYAMALVTQEIISPTPTPRIYVLLLSIFNTTHRNLIDIATFNSLPNETWLNSQLLRLKDAGKVL